MADSVVFGMAIDLAGLRTGLSLATGLVRGTVGRIERAFEALANPFAALGVAAVGGGLALMVKSALELGDSLDEMSSRIGVGVVALQELQHAARVSGASTEELETGLKFLNKNLGEAAAGDQKAINLFKDLGISVTDAAGGMRDAGTVIDDVADRIAGIENPAERTRVILELFGRSGTALIPMLEGGRKGLQAFRDEANRLGLVLDQDMIKAAGKAHDELDSLAAAIKINLTRAVLQFTPELLDMAAKLNSFMGGLKNVVEFFGKNQSVGVLELTARLGEARSEAEQLQAVLQDMSAGRHPIQEPSAPGGRVEVEARLATSQARIATLEKLLEQKSAPAAARKPTTPVVSQEQLDKIDELRKKVIAAAIPDPVAQSIVKFRQEVDKLAGDIPGKADEIRTFGKAFEDITTGVESAKKAITDLQAVDLAKNLGLGDTNLFAGFAEIDKIKTEASQFGEAIQGLVKRGVPLKDVFDLIGQSQDALSLKTANLREKFAQQPLILEQIRKELAGVDFGAFGREQDALARSFTGVNQGAAILEDALGNRLFTALGMAQTGFGEAAKSSDALTAVLFRDMPSAAKAAGGSLVVLTEGANRLAEALANATRMATFLNLEIGRSGQVAVPPPGNFE